MNEPKIPLNANYLVCFLALIAASATLAGCCTGNLVKKANQKTVDAFFPTKVFGCTNSNNYVLEGNVCKSQPEISLHNAPSNHAYLEIAKTNFAKPWYRSNGDYELVQARSYVMPKQARIRDSLPSNYAPIADLKHSNYIKFKEHYPHRGALLFLPFSICVDVGTAPFQIPMLLFLNSGVGHGP